MDMKKILNAMDGTSNASGTGNDGMKHLINIITEGSKPVKTAKTKKPKLTGLRKYLAESEHKAPSASIYDIYEVSEEDEVPLEQDSESTDVIHVDVPLFIRLMEFAREEAQDDAELHDLSTKLIELCQNDNVCTMDDYEQLMGEQKMLPNPDEMEP